MPDVTIVGSPDPIPGEWINLTAQTGQPLEVLVKGHAGAVAEIVEVIKQMYQVVAEHISYAHHPVESGKPDRGRLIITRHKLTLATASGAPELANSCPQKEVDR